MAPSKSKNKSNKKSPKQQQTKTAAKTNSSVPSSSALDILSSSPDSSSSSTDHHHNSGSPTLLYFESDPFTNNGSSCCSGEEDPVKESTTKTTPLENNYITVPGLDNDRREKIRLKNEKKHARQKERRAQELHDRCCGLLMSRKLESLAQQIVAMGFSKERAAAALMMNEGKVEESVNWLFEGNGDSTNDNEKGDVSGSELRNLGLKIDISEELAQISALEIRFKCSKQEVERAVVGCEGDLEKATEALQASQKPAQPPSPPPPPPAPQHGNVDLVPRKRLLQNSDIVNRTAQNQNWGCHGHGHGYSSSFPSSHHSSSKPYPIQTPPRWYSSNNVPMIVNQRPPRQHHRGPASYKETPFLFSNPMDASSSTRMEGASWTGGSRSLSFPAAASSLPSLAAPSSLGLFASWGSPNSQVDWSTGGLMSNFDYTNIDWSLDSNMLPASNKSRRRMWVGISSLLMSNTGSGNRRTGAVEASSSSSSAPEWTSPFAQKDMFSLYRQFVTPPSL